MYRYLAVICCRKPSENLLIYLGTCGVCGLGWLAYFLCHMSFRQFLDGLSEMLTDGSHDVGLLGKLKDNLSCLGETFPYLLAALVIALVFWCFFRFICRKNYRFFLLLIISLILEQLFVWYRLQKHIEYPGFVYLLFPLWGIYCYFRRKKSSGELAPVYKALFWFGSITSLFCSLPLLQPAIQCSTSLPIIWLSVCWFLYAMQSGKHRNLPFSGNLLSCCLWDLPSFTKDFCCIIFTVTTPFSSHGRKRKRAPWQESTAGIPMATSIISGDVC